MRITTQMDQAAYNGIIAAAQTDGFVTTGSSWTDVDNLIIEINRPVAPVPRNLPTGWGIAADMLSAGILAVVTLAFAFGQASNHTDPNYPQMFGLCGTVFALVFAGFFCFQWSTRIAGWVDDIVLNAIGTVLIGYAVVLLISVSPWKSVPIPFNVFPDVDTVRIRYEELETLPEISGLSYTDTKVTLPSDSGRIAYFWREVGKKEFAVLTSTPPSVEIIEVVGMAGNKPVTQVATIRRK